MTDYERGVEQASNIYREVIREYVAENAKLRKFVYDMWNDMNVYYTQHESPDSSDMDFYRDSMREMGIEVE